MNSLDPIRDAILSTQHDAPTIAALAVAVIAISSIPMLFVLAFPASSFFSALKVFVGTGLFFGAGAIGAYLGTQENAWNRATMIAEILQDPESQIRVFTDAKGRTIGGYVSLESTTYESAIAGRTSTVGPRRQEIEISSIEITALQGTTSGKSLDK